MPSNTSHAPRPHFMVLEGVDGSGKTTQAQLLAEWYRKQGATVVITREPGGSVLGERLRAILLDPNIACAPRAELLTFMAARAQHVAEVIAPALAAGAIVISDRFSLSTQVYQGVVRGLPQEDIQAVDEVAVGGVHPDITLLLDVPYEIVYARIGERRDRFEGEGGALLRKVIEGYRRLAAEDRTIRIVDGSGSVAQVQQILRRELSGISPADGGAL